MCGGCLLGWRVCLRLGRVPVFRYRRVTPHRPARRRPLVSDHGEARGALYDWVQYGLTGNLVAFLSCRRFSVSVTGGAFDKGEDSGGGKHTFVEVCLRSGIVHETHYKFRGPWRRLGGGSFGFFCCPREAWSWEAWDL